MEDVPGFLGGVLGFLGSVPGFLGVFRIFWGVFRVVGGVPGFLGVPVFLEVLHAKGNGLDLGAEPPHINIC